MKCNKSTVKKTQECLYHNDFVIQICTLLLASLYSVFPSPNARNSPIPNTLDIYVAYV